MMNGLIAQRLNIAAVRMHAFLVAREGDKETAHMLVMLTDVIQQQAAVIDVLMQLSPKEVHHGRNAQDQIR